MELPLNYDVTAHWEFVFSGRENAEDSCSFYASIMQAPDLQLLCFMVVIFTSQYRLRHLAFYGDSVLAKARCRIERDTSEISRADGTATLT